MLGKCILLITVMTMTTMTEIGLLVVFLVMKILMRQWSWCTRLDIVWLTLKRDWNLLMVLPLPLPPTQTPFTHRQSTIQQPNATTKVSTNGSTPSPFSTSTSTSLPPRPRTTRPRPPPTPQFFQAAPNNSNSSSNNSSSKSTANQPSHPSPPPPTNSQACS